MTLSERALNGPALAGELFAAPFLAWPWWSIAAVILAALVVWRRPPKRNLGWFAASPIGWLLMTVVAGWLTCDRATGGVCVAGWIAIPLLVFGVVGPIYGAVLVWRLRGARIAASAVWIANCAYTLLATLAAGEALAGVSL